MDKTLEDFVAARDAIRGEMGGAEKIRRLHARGDNTARDWIHQLLDSDSFSELGTFVHSHREEDAATTPGDGKIGGVGAVDGRTVVVCADDVTVRAASDAHSSHNKVYRLYDQAKRLKVPFVHFGQSAGGRVPDIMGSEVFAAGRAMRTLPGRRRQSPMVTAIVGRSFGESSFLSALSDFSVMLSSGTMSVTSPRVIEVATGEKITVEELGGVDVNTKVTGQIDAVVETKEELLRTIKQFLSYLPTNASEKPPRGEDVELRLVPEMRTIVPAQRQRAYDMRRLLTALVDAGEFLEIRKHIGRSAITALARIGGVSVGVIASQPMQQAGALTPDACDKIVRLLCLCDSFNLPVVFLQDSSGFLVGKQVEHARMLYRAVAVNEAIENLSVPRLVVVVRKGYGLAYYSLGGGPGSALLCAWPGSEISFMDPQVAVNVLYADKLDAALPEERDATHRELVEQMTVGTHPEAAAAVMAVDEIIDPAETRQVIGRQLRRCMDTLDPKASARRLASWPTTF